MNQPSYTKDERYLVTAYQEFLKQNDEECELDRYLVGEVARISPKGVDTIVLQLVRGNFLKKRGDQLILLTDVGKKVAQSLIDEVSG